MKLSRGTIVLAGAVLVGALVVGLVIRQARMGAEPQKPVRRDPLPKQTTQSTVEERQRIKDERAKKLEEFRNLTPEEQKKRVEEEVTRRLGTSQPNDVNAPARRAPTRLRSVRPVPDANGGVPVRTKTLPQNGNGSQAIQDPNRPK